MHQKSKVQTLAIRPRHRATTVGGQVLQLAVSFRNRTIFSKWMLVKRPYLKNAVHKARVSKVI